MIDKKNEPPRESSNGQLKVVDWQDLVKLFVHDYEIYHEDDMDWMPEEPLSIKRWKFRFQSDD